MLRTPLQQLCLTVKATLPGSAAVADTLSQLLTPPAASAVAAAVDELRRIGALTPEEDLTPLGSHLAQMPMDAKLGKALLYGAMLRCACIFSTSLPPASEFYPTRSNREALVERSWPHAGA